MSRRRAEYAGPRILALTSECEHPAYLPDEPHGYLQWHAWAEQKSKTHHQERCPHCGLYAIWLPGPPIVPGEAGRGDSFTMAAEPRVAPKPASIGGSSDA